MARKLDYLLFGLALAFFVFSGYSFVQYGKKKKIIISEKAPKPIGPYSQAVLSGNTLYVSGTVAINSNGVLDTTDIKTETRIALDNISEILKAAGMTTDQVVKATVYMKDLKKFSEMNEVYSAYFREDPPARETVEIRNLPKGAHIEISVVAVIP